MSEGTRWSRFFQNRFVRLVVRLLGVVAFAIGILVVADMRNAEIRGGIEIVEFRLDQLEDSSLEAAIKQIRDARDASRPVPQFMVVNTETAAALSGVVEWWSLDADSDGLSDRGPDVCPGSVSSYRSVSMDVNGSGCTAQQLFSNGGCSSPVPIPSSTSFELTCGDEKIHCVVDLPPDGSEVKPSWGACKFPSGS